MQKQEIIRSLQFLGWIALVILFIGLLVAAAKRKGIERIRNIEIAIQPLPDTENLITSGDILELLNKSFGYSFDGVPQNQIDVERTERVLKSYPFVLDADAFIDAQNALRIDIQQRNPVLRIIDKMEVSYYFDKFGNKLPLSKNHTARVLIATGNIPPYVPDFQERNNHVLNYTFSLAQKILNDSFLKSMVEQIHINKKNEFILIPKLGKQKILLGHYDNIDDKLENLVVFYQNAIATKGWRLYRTIDLRYREQVIGIK